MRVGPQPAVGAAAWAPLLADLILSVSDNGGRGSPGRSGTGVGLDNTRRRLEVIYGRRGRLETLAHDGGFTALIRIPAQQAPALGLVA